MDDISQIHSLQEILGRRRGQGLRIGFVPTMGNIHAGHLKLLEQCREECDFSLASIFVNPLQFGPGEDFAKYPRTLERDRELLSSHGCDLLWRPSAREMYGEHPELATRVHVPGLSERYCGASRPGHFDGVTTVVARLLNFTRPDSAYFGLKDYQQFLLIRKMIDDLGMGVAAVGVETVRESDGLAMSSRNAYLSPEERVAAPALYRCLRDVARRISAGNRNYDRVAADGIDALAAAGFQPDYLDICNADTLGKAEDSDTELAILAAARLGGTRLIDNLRLAIGPPPGA